MARPNNSLAMAPGVQAGPLDQAATAPGYRDYKLHLDYIHVDPVKRGLLHRPRDWPWSTFHAYVKKGEYDLDWCGHVHLPGGTDIEPEGWA